VKEIGVVGGHLFPEKCEVLSPAADVSGIEKWALRVTGKGGESTEEYEDNQPMHITSGVERERRHVRQSGAVDG